MQQRQKALNCFRGPIFKSLLAFPEICNDSPKLKSRHNPLMSSHFPLKTGFRKLQRSKNPKRPCWGFARASFFSKLHVILESPWILEILNVYSTKIWGKRPPSNFPEIWQTSSSYYSESFCVFSLDTIWIPKFIGPLSRDRWSQGSWTALSNSLNRKKVHQKWNTYLNLFIVAR